ncbi:hypothetical protein C8J56DRAFT_192483 [Mycena floridula]|nr:hypothetical protein C8J56DRAFT_192483 [Mycena floridula]
MIIVEDNPGENSASPIKSQPNSPLSLNESELPPPQYEPRAGLLSPSTEARAINYISIHRKIGPLNEKHVLDPTIQIPPSLLPPLLQGETEDSRRHLSLETKTGSIQADITLVDKLSSDILHKSGRVVMGVKTFGVGAISVQVHASDSPTRLRFCLRTSTRSGAVTIHLPRSFRGNLIISVPIGVLNVSEDLHAQLTTISEDGHLRRCFVGDMAHPDSFADDVDQLHAETTVGNVTLLYDDEKLDEKLGGFVKMTSGLFGRLMSRWN